MRRESGVVAALRARPVLARPGVLVDSEAGQVAELAQHTLRNSFRRIDPASARVILLDAAPADTWTADSPCEGWTGRDVVGHVIDTQREFFSHHDIDAGPAPSLDDPAAAWHTHRDTVAGLLADPTVGERTFDGHFGPTTIGETLIRFYGFDMVAHRWDVATAERWLAPILNYDPYAAKRETAA